MEMETDRREEEEEIRERYVLSMERIRAMKEETAVSAPFYDYFQRTADFILEAADFAETIRLGRLEERTLPSFRSRTGGFTRISKGKPIRAATRIRRTRRGCWVKDTGRF